MPLRFLITGDLQCHNFRQFSYVRKDGQNSRLHNCLKIFKIIRHEAKKRGITKVLLNGDILEENSYIDVSVYDAVYQELEKLHSVGLDVVINVGNHDVCGQSDGRTLHSLRPFGKIAQVVETPTLVWGRLQVVPWMDPEKLKTVLRGLRADRRGALVLHCGVQGATTGPGSYLVRNPIKLADIRRKDFAAVILSDYHTRQFLARNVFYLGSPLQHSFGEIHQPCIWEINLDGRSYMAKKIYTELPVFRRCLIKAGEGIKSLESKSVGFAGDYVRVELREGAEVSDREIERLAEKRGFLVQIEHKGHAKDDSEQSVHMLAPEEAIEQYVKSHSKERHQHRLRKLGEQIYKGEL